MNKSSFIFLSLLLLVLFVQGAVLAQENDFRRLSVQEYRSKLESGWIGQMAGVCWGETTEFKFQGIVIPEDQMPSWSPEMINHSFNQDDLYVEMTFLKTIEDYGPNVSIRQAGIDFANSAYQLWHANMVGRGNLRHGIAPPDSGHPQFNPCCDDIDYQIEADYSGLIAPGMPHVAQNLGNTFGRLMNHGDGLYGGIFIGSMYAEAYFEKDIRKIIMNALQSIPPDSQYAEMVRDVCSWYDENPNDWLKTWGKIDAKYQKNPNYRRVSCDPGKYNIDAKINGAYVLVGLLYGKGNMDQTIIISTRCGQDSDCNPSSAAGVLATSLGLQNLSPKFYEKIDHQAIFSHTSYTFPKLLDACERIARKIVIAEGGRIEVDATNNEIFVIPVIKPTVLPYEPSFKPEKSTGERYSDDEMSRIRIRDFTFANIQGGIDKFYPGWTISDCGVKQHPGIRENFRGRKNVLATYPKNVTIPCVLSREVTVPRDQKTFLRLSVAPQNKPEAGWELIVKVDGNEIQREKITAKTQPQGWKDFSIDLSSHAGKTVKVELLNQSSEVIQSAALWSVLDVD